MYASCAWPEAFVVLSRSRLHSGHAEARRDLEESAACEGGLRSRRRREKVGTTAVVTSLGFVVICVS